MSETVGRPKLLRSCAALAAVVLAVAVADFARTADRVPPVPRPCPVATDSACNEARNAQFRSRLERARELEEAYRGRAWAYALLAVAAGAGALGVALGGRTLPERRRLFTSLGVAGVLLGVVTIGSTSLVDAPLVDEPMGPALVPTLAMLGAAAAGEWLLGARVPRPALEGGGPPRALRRERRAVRGGLVLTGLTVLLALVFMSPQPDCSTGGGEAPGWTAVVAALAVATAASAVALGALSLALRRWVVALACLIVNPFALLTMIASTCAFY